MLEMRNSAYREEVKYKKCVEKRAGHQPKFKLLLLFKKKYLFTYLFWLHQLLAAACGNLPCGMWASYLRHA